MRIRSFLQLVLLLVLAVSSASAQLVESWDAAKSTAAASGRFIVIDFWADWCGPCKRFDAASDEDPALRAALDGVVLFKTDAERAGLDLAEQFEVGGYPTYVILNSQAETVGRWWGFEAPEEWMEKFSGVMADPTTMEEKSERYAKAPNADDAFILGRFHETREDYATGMELYRAALQLDPDQHRRYEEALFDAAYSAHRDGVLEFGIVEEWAQTVLAWGDAASAEDLYYLARSMTSAARREGTPDAAGRYLTVALDRLASDAGEQSKERHDVLAIDHALIVEKDKDKAFNLKKASLQPGWDQDSSTMNGFAWWCFENAVNLVEAEEVARAAVELAETDGAKANVLDTVAQICNLRGDCHEAVSLIKQALELNPNSSYLKRQLAKFEEALEATG